jgi:hypothetical protein
MRLTVYVGFVIVGGGVTVIVCVLSAGSVGHVGCDMVTGVWVLYVGSVGHVG